jgi:hypothetical protein
MEQVTLIAAPSVLDFRAKPPGQSYAGMGVLEAGARVKLYELDEWMFSAQGTLREATNTRSPIFLDMGLGLQADVRLLIGPHVHAPWPSSLFQSRDRLPLARRFRP